MKNNEKYYKEVLKAKNDLISEERDTEEWKVFCEEAMTRVNRKINGKLQWCSLPIHIAISPRSPAHLIQALISANHKSCMCKDYCDQLPRNIVDRRDDAAIIDLTIDGKLDDFQVQYK